MSDGHSSFGNVQSSLVQTKNNIAHVTFYLMPGAVVKDK